MSNPNELDDWIKSLYDEDMISLTYRGKLLKFKKRFSMGLGMSLKDKPEDEQIYTLLAILSADPIFTKDQIAKLPIDLVGQLATEIGMDYDFLKKKLAPRPK